MFDHEKDPKVDHVLKMKTQFLKSTPKLKVIRSGLPIRANDGDLR